METKCTGKYRTKRNYVNFVTGLKGKIRLNKKEAFINGEKLSMMLEGSKFKIKLYEDNSIDFEEINTTLTDNDMILRLIDEIDSLEVTGYVQKFVVNSLEFQDEDGKICYLEVEHQKPIERMFSIFEEKSELSKQGLSILDSLLSEKSDIKQEPNKVEKNIAQTDKKIQTSESKKFLRESFEKMNKEKIEELKLRIQSKESEFLRNNIDLQRCETKSKTISDEIKLLNVRLKSMLPKEEPVGYYFFVSTENKTGIELDDSLKNVVEKISPILNLKTNAVLELLTKGYFNIHIQKENGDKDIEKDIVQKVLSIDINGKFEIIKKNQIKYTGELTWHQLVDSLLFKGFEQNIQFDKECGSNSYNSEKN